MLKTCGKRARFILLQAAGFIARAERLMLPLSHLVETGAAGLDQPARTSPLLVSAGLSPIGAMGARKKCLPAMHTMHTAYTVFPQGHFQYGIRASV
jgi:hypothetical protein